MSASSRRPAVAGAVQAVFNASRDRSSTREPGARSRAAPPRSATQASSTGRSSAASAPRARRARGDVQPRGSRGGPARRGRAQVRIARQEVNVRGARRLGRDRAPRGLRNQTADPRRSSTTSPCPRRRGDRPVARRREISATGVRVHGLAARGGAGVYAPRSRAAKTPRCSSRSARGSIACAPSRSRRAGSRRTRRFGFHRERRRNALLAPLSRPRQGNAWPLPRLAEERNAFRDRAAPALVGACADVSHPTIWLPPSLPAPSPTAASRAPRPPRRVDHRRPPPRPLPRRSPRVAASRWCSIARAACAPQAARVVAAMNGSARESRRRTTCDLYLTSAPSRGRGPRARSTTPQRFDAPRGRLLRRPGSRRAAGAVRRRSAATRAMTASWC